MIKIPPRQASPHSSTTVCSVEAQTAGSTGSLVPHDHPNVARADAELDAVGSSGWALLHHFARPLRQEIG